MVSCSCTVSPSWTCAAAGDASCTLNESRGVSIFTTPSEILAAGFYAWLAGTKARKAMRARMRVIAETSFVAS